jgi:hypothetical protein
MNRLDLRRAILASLERPVPGDTATCPLHVQALLETRSGLVHAFCLIEILPGAFVPGRLPLGHVWN